MGQVDIRINGQPYQLVCDDGQESHLIKLAESINQRVVNLAQSVGQVGEARLLLMAGLLIADELAEAQQALQNSAGQNTGDGDESALADLLDNLAARIESLVSRLEAA